MKIYSNPAIVNIIQKPVCFGNKDYKNNNQVNLDQFKKYSPCIADYDIDISNGDLKKIYLRKPVNVWEVFDSIVNSDDIMLKSRFVRAFHTMEELRYISENLKKFCFCFWNWGW